MSTTSLQGLRAFCAAARSGSFKIASEEIFISASAISHRIKNLEQQLGIPLFERQTRAIKLTVDGEALLKKIAPLIEQIDAEIELITGQASISQLTITLPPFFSTELLLPKLNQFTSQHQNIALNLDTTDVHPEKHPDTSDLSILICEEPPVGFQSQALFPLVLIPACSPSFAFNNDKHSLDALDNTTLIIHRSRNNAWNDWFKERGYKRKNPGNILVLDSMSAVVTAAEQGLGIALVPKRLSTSSFVNKRLIRVMDEELVTGFMYYLVAREKDFEKKELKPLSDWIIETFQPLNR